MFRIYEIEVPQIGTYVKFKILPPEDINSFVEDAILLEREEYIKYVLDNLIFNMKPDIVESLKMMSRDDARKAVEALYNGCIMLNPGLDVENWVDISFSNALVDKTPKVPELASPVDQPPYYMQAQEEDLKHEAKTRKRLNNKLSKTKFLNLSKYLKEKVVGQDEAIDSVVNALKRSQAGLGDELRPLGIFLFAGASGVGKTHLAKELHKYLFGEDHEIVRIDCGEYQHKHENQKLLGAPPGYLAYEEGGYLTNAVRARPNTVVLLDEVEKAHPDIWNTFLRVFDEGIITSNKGQEVNFRSTVIIMTTNLGNDKVVETLNAAAIGFSQDARQLEKKNPPRTQVEREANKAINKLFKPEFLNRIDKTVIFNHLLRDDFVKIAELELKVVEDKLAKKGLMFTFDAHVIDTLVATGVDAIKGARGMAQIRRDKIEDQLADILIETRCPRGTIFELVTIKDSFGINVRRPSRVKKAELKEV